MEPHNLSERLLVGWHRRSKAFIARKRIVDGIALLVCASATVCMSGCASVVVKKVPPENSESIEGVRFYRPVPYLLVSEAASSESASPAAKSPIRSASRFLQFTIIWMPDLSQDYTIQTKPGLGSIEFNPALEDGWKLTSLNGKVDSKAAEILAAVGTVVPKASAKGVPEVAGHRLVPGMYAFQFDRDRKSPTYGRLTGIDLAHPIFTSSE